MKFYEFGRWDAPVLMLLPGTCCHWRANFGHVIPLLQEDFHIICASYDGFDEAEDAVFPDMLTEAQRIEAFIRQSFDGRICAAYGCSLGGSLVGLLIQRGNVHIEHGILGSSDLDQEEGLSARLKAWLVARMLYGILQKGRIPGWMQRRLDGKAPGDRAYAEKMLKMMGLQDGSMRFVRRESIRNQFYSDLVTPLEQKISAPGTTVHCFYAQKMGERYLARYLKHFCNPDIVAYDLRHEELLVNAPEQWVGEIRRCCTGRKDGGFS